MSEFATKLVEQLSEHARNLNEVNASLSAWIEQQREINERLEEVVVTLGGVPPRPRLTVVSDLTVSTEEAD